VSTRGCTTDTDPRREPDSPAPRIDSEQHLATLKALGDATRLRLIRLLYHEELNVQELCTILGIPQPNVSRHLNVLRSTGLVTDRREGTKVYCSLADLRGERAAFREYVVTVGESNHRDLQRLEESLRVRANAARSFADSTAAQWDDIGKILHNTSASLLAVAHMAPRGMSIADLGTGTGLLLPILSAMAETVYAVDQSGAMLRRARSRCRNSAIDNVKFVHKPIEKLDHDLPPCDALLLHFVLHQIARPPALLQRLHGFLKPGGRLVIVDRVQHTDEQAKTTFGSLWLGFSRQQLLEWLVAAGYEDAAWQPVPGAAPAETPLPVFVAAAHRGKC
jgi:ArsR family transcriptional regulator